MELAEPLTGDELLEGEMLEVFQVWALGLSLVLSP
jgi:hypothetical protein